MGMSVGVLWVAEYGLTPHHKWAELLQVLRARVQLDFKHVDEFRGSTESRVFFFQS